MTTAIMRSIYLALYEGLSCPVSRAWPQQKPGLPSCVFFLHSWEALPHYKALCRIGVTLRVTSPAQGDDLSLMTLYIMAEQGFTLLSARDAQESQTGFFLKEMVFQAQAFQETSGAVQVNKWPQALRLLSGSNWLNLPQPLTLQLITGHRDAINKASFALDGLPLPGFGAGRMQPAALQVSAPFVAADPASNLVYQSFIEGRYVTFSIRSGSADYYDSGGIFSACLLSPLGLSATLTLNQGFVLAT